MAVTVQDIIAFEEGSLGFAETLTMFGELIATGQAWQLQGAYGRTAAGLIAEEVLTPRGELTDHGRDLIAEHADDDAPADVAHYADVVVTHTSNPDPTYLASLAAERVTPRRA